MVSDVIAVVFPGQGSQKPGMGKELVERHAQAAEVFDRVSQATNQDLRKLCFETDENTLRQTQNAQIALYTSGLAAYFALRSLMSPEAAHRLIAMAGHSVGEYAALAASNVFSIEEGAKLVQARGEVMARSGKEWPGTMAAVLGLSKEQLDAVCTSTAGVVVVANDNCPGQLVISGEIDAVASAGQFALEQGAKRTIPLNVSGAFHSPLMDQPAKEMAIALKKAQVGTSPSPNVYSNVTTETVANPDDWPTLLERQLKSPVLWTKSVEHMIRDGVSTFIECGVGEVLSGLVRRIDKSRTTLKVNDEATLQETLAAIL